MSRLVSVQQVKDRARIDTDAGDSDIDLMIQAASSEILAYLQGGEFAWTDSDGEPASEDSDGVGVDIPAGVQNACIMYVSILSKNRDKVEGVEWEHGFMPAPVISLLRQFWTPSV